MFTLHDYPIQSAEIESSQRERHTGSVLEKSLKPELCLVRSVFDGPQYPSKWIQLPQVTRSLQAYRPEDAL